MGTGLIQRIRNISLSSLAIISAFQFHRKRKVHDFTSFGGDVDYVFEAIDPRGLKAYMTGRGRGIRPGDQLLLKQDNMTIQYQVEKIDYYAHPSDMWIGLLSKI